MAVGRRDSRRRRPIRRRGRRPPRRERHAVLRGLDADARLVRAGGQGARRGRDQPDGGRRPRVEKGESLIDTVRTLRAIGARHARDAPRDVGRAVPRGGDLRRHVSSTPATAGTPTRRRRCSTCTRSGGTAGATGAKGGCRRGGRSSSLATCCTEGRAEQHLDADHGRRRRLWSAGHRRCCRGFGAWAAAGAGGGGTRRRTSMPRSGCRRGDDAADAAGADGRRACCRACASTPACIR